MLKQLLYIMNIHFFHWIYIIFHFDMRPHKVYLYMMYHIYSCGGSLNFSIWIWGVSSWRIMNNEKKIQKKKAWNISLILYIICPFEASQGMTGLPERRKDDNGKNRSVKQWSPWEWQSFTERRPGSGSKYSWGSRDAEVENVKLIHLEKN